MDKWRLLRDGRRGGRYNMAVDEAMLARADKLTFSGGSPASTLRLYGWKEPTISVGYLQNLGKLASFGLPLVRRVTGGRAVLHDVELTYSVVVGAGSPLYKSGIEGLYLAVSSAIVEALKSAGIEAGLARPTLKGGVARKEACFLSPSRFEVMVGGRKLVGSAQRRLKGAAIQHGSILFKVDAGQTHRVFGPGVAAKMTCVGDHSDIGIEDFSELFVESFSSRLDVSFYDGELDGYERELVEETLSQTGPGESGKGRVA